MKTSSYADFYDVLILFKPFLSRLRGHIYIYSLKNWFHMVNAYGEYFLTPCIVLGDTLKEPRVARSGLNYWEPVNYKQNLKSNPALTEIISNLGFPASEN